MDFATEERLCRLAHEVWRRAAAEPVDATDRDERGAAEHEVMADPHRHEVFASDAALP